MAVRWKNQDYSHEAVSLESITENNPLGNLNIAKFKPHIKICLVDFKGNFRGSQLFIVLT